MSNLTESQNGLDLFVETNGHKHQICVGDKCAYCMDCGKILIEFEDKKNFKKLMNPFSDDDYD